MNSLRAKNTHNHLAQDNRVEALVQWEFAGSETFLITAWIDIFTNGKLAIHMFPLPIWGLLFWNFSNFSIIQSELPRYLDRADTSCTEDVMAEHDFGKQQPSTNIGPHLPNSLYIVFKMSGAITCSSEPTKKLVGPRCNSNWTLSRERG